LFTAALMRSLSFTRSSAAPVTRVSPLAYAAMQACGVVNDHLATCPAREAVERARAAVQLPG